MCRNHKVDEIVSFQQSQDVVKYHVILSEQLFPEHLGDGLFKNTFLGNGTQIMFYVDTENQVLHKTKLYSVPIFCTVLKWK